MVDCASKPAMRMQRSGSHMKCVRLTPSQSTWRNENPGGGTYRFFQPALFHGLAWKEPRNNKTCAEDE